MVLPLRELRFNPRLPVLVVPVLRGSLKTGFWIVLLPGSYVWMLLRSLTSSSCGGFVSASGNTFFGILLPLSSFSSSLWYPDSLVYLVHRPSDLSYVLLSTLVTTHFTIAESQAQTPSQNAVTVFRCTATVTLICKLVRDRNAAGY